MSNPMLALDVLNIAQALTVARQIDSLTSNFLRAVATHLGTALRHALCYQRNADGDRLLPLSSTDLPLGELPEIALDELDNPLIYTMLDKQPCLVEHVDRLIDVGDGFEALRQRVANGAWLAVPLLDDDRRHAVAVIVLIGLHASLQAWRDDPAWQMLTTIQQQLFARLTSQQSVVENARYERAAHRDRSAAGHRAAAARLLAAEWVGDSSETQHIRAEILLIADSALAVLVTGETGVGKDHAAWLIHQTSARSGKAFVPVNCAAIPKELIEAELFGSTRGAYTGATQARDGLVAAADGGTLFLDEIGDMPFVLQGTLLRLLNEKKYRPLGATQERASDFRLICATHQPLPQLVRAGRFREDLYFRIRQLSLHLPPLRKRPEDIAPLVNHVVIQHNRERQAHVAGIDADALTLLQAHAFPGNVRELRSLVLVASERVKNGQPIDAATLQKLLTPTVHGPDVVSQALHGQAIDPAFAELLNADNLPEACENFERLMIGARLRGCHGSRTRAAQSLGIPKRTLARKCQKWNLAMESS